MNELRQFQKSVIFPLWRLVVGTRYEWKSREILIITAEALKQASEQLTQVAVDMQQRGMSDALFPWTTRQNDCLKIIGELAKQCLDAIPLQIIAKAQNRPSCFELAKQKSARDGAARKIRNANVPAKTRGRPRKVLAET
jgi:hypothetical protein